MTAEEVISIARLAHKVDDMADDMVTKDLLRAEVGRIDGAIEAHIKYTRDSAVAEAKRLDSIREVDAMAVRVANDRAVEQAGILAKQVESVASTLRELVSTTASTAAEAQIQLFAPIVTRLQKVEDKQNEDRGAAKYTDPMLAGLAEKVDALVNALSEGRGKGAGMNALWGYIIGAIGVLSAILAIASRFAQ